MDIFSLKGRNAVVIGGAGVLGRAIARGLADFGAAVAVTSRTAERAEVVAASLVKTKIKAKGYAADTMDESSLRSVLDQINSDFGQVDILVNAVGGNRSEATVSDEQSFFDLPIDALQNIVDLNLFAGAIIPAKVFGQAMAGNERGGSIINVSSMTAFRPLTRVVAYSAAKAAVTNFTQWLAVYFAQSGMKKVRVNAIAPGFFFTEQNRYLLVDKTTGDLTARGRAILDHTPMSRFGEPADLTGAVVWLASDASCFVTGTVIPIDGGFSAYSGV